MQAAQQAAADAALSNPAARLNATSELQQLSAHALMAQQDGDAAPVSSREFLARVEAARMAAEPDTATLRTASTPVGGAPSLGQVVSMFDAAAAGLHAGGALRSQERIQARMAGTGTAQGLVTWGDATPVGTQHGASAVYAPGALTPAPATAMAEKVHYWVSRGVQSASLQLDAFAGGSVDVSIAVKGDEAIIEFRTDQPQARQLLLEAMPQLKELLASEGLMLSGGFVGTSTQQGRQSQGGGAPQTTAREALVGAPQATPGRTGVLDVVSGGRVDLFV
jgi:flagellar hook-length control protein FliK